MKIFPAASARDWHVATTGTSSADGSFKSPFSSIQAAAELAMPGDTILIHTGTYRERIDPPRGGLSEESRITYCAAGDGPVEIKGSEIVNGWISGTRGAWTVDVSNAWFGDFNPYQRTISGHWFYPKGRLHHPGAVYLDGHWLVEAASLNEVLTATDDDRLWFAEVGEMTTKITARFGGMNPCDRLVEINVRQSVFYPSREGRNFITVRGLTLLHAATPWAPPTTEQIGLIGCHWSKGWIIEDCVVRYSACAGITLGKYHDPEDYPDLPVVEHTDGEDTFHGTIRRALAHGWNLENVGSHVVRNNTVSHCEMAGICGSLGALCSVIEGNTVHDIHVHRLFNGFEQAGIKFHGAIDTRIVGNRIFRCNRGIWLDWMSQGTRVSRNVCHDNGPDPDMFTEVNHGPFVIDHNCFLSVFSLRSQSDGGAYVCNLFLGRVEALAEHTRVTPYFELHSTRIAGWKHIMMGDDRFIGNLFAEGRGSSDYDAAELPVQFQSNFYARGAKPSVFDGDGVAIHAPDLRVEVRDNSVSLHGVPLEHTDFISSKISEEMNHTVVSGLAFKLPEKFEIARGNVPQGVRERSWILWPLTNR